MERWYRARLHNAAGARASAMGLVTRGMESMTTARMLLSGAIGGEEEAPYEHHRPHPHHGTNDDNGGKATLHGAAGAGVDDADEGDGAYEVWFNLAQGWAARGKWELAAVHAIDAMAALAEEAGLDLDVAMGVEDPDDVEPRHDGPRGGPDDARSGNAPRRHAVHARLAVLGATAAEMYVLSGRVPIAVQWAERAAHLDPGSARAQRALTAACLLSAYSSLKLEHSSVSRPMHPGEREAALARDDGAGLDGAVLEIESGSGVTRAHAYSETEAPPMPFFEAARRAHHAAEAWRSIDDSDSNSDSNSNSNSNSGDHQKATNHPDHVRVPGHRPLAARTLWLTGHATVARDLLAESVGGPSGHSACGPVEIECTLALAWALVDLQRPTEAGLVLRDLALEAERQLPSGHDSAGDHTATTTTTASGSSGARSQVGPPAPSSNEIRTGMDPALLLCAAAPAVLHLAAVLRAAAADLVGAELRLRLAVRARRECGPPQMPTGSDIPHLVTAARLGALLRRNGGVGGLGDGEDTDNGRGNARAALDVARRVYRHFRTVPMVVAELARAHYALGEGIDAAKHCTAAGRSAIVDAHTGMFCPPPIASKRTSESVPVHEDL
jgi:hypothetical protein